MELSFKKTTYFSLVILPFFSWVGANDAQYRRDLQELYELSQNNHCYCDHDQGTYSSKQFDDKVLSKFEVLKEKWAAIKAPQHHSQGSFERLNLRELQQDMTPELCNEASRTFELLYEGARSVSRLMHFYEDLILMIANCRGYEGGVAEESFDGLISMYIKEKGAHQELMTAADALYDQWSSVDVGIEADEGKTYNELTRYGKLRESFKKLVVTKHSSLNKKTYSGATKAFWESSLRKTTRWMNTGVITNEAEDFASLSGRLEAESAVFLDRENWPCMVKYLIDEALWEKPMYNACMTQCIKGFLASNTLIPQTTRHRARTNSARR